MKSIFVICFLTFFSVGLDEEINWLEVRPDNIDLSDIIKLQTCKAQKRLGAQEKIIGGEEAVSHSFPYQAGLLLDMKYLCGGSLLTPEYVLTAAHCLEKKRVAIVFLGAHNLSERTDDIRVPSTNFIIHEKWEISRPFDDIALVKLRNPVELTQYIQLIHLPPRSLPDLTGKLVTTTGWGATTDERADFSFVLRYVEIKVISNVECTTYLQGLIRDTNVCTSGEDGKTACFGDSGGPLVFKESDKSVTIVGVASFLVGIGCERGFPMAYARVTSYLDWISSHTGLTIKD